MIFTYICMLFFNIIIIVCLPKLIKSDPVLLSPQMDEVSLWWDLFLGIMINFGRFTMTNKRNAFSIKFYFILFFDAAYSSVVSKALYVFIQMFKGWTNHWRILWFIFRSRDIQQPDIRSNFAGTTISQYWKSCNCKIRISE